MVVMRRVESTEKDCSLWLAYLDEINKYKFVIDLLLTFVNFLLLNTIKIKFISYNIHFNSNLVLLWLSLILFP